MHSTWGCITHSCYITLARKFKTSGLGWKWWFNYYLWTTTTTERGKKASKHFFFFFFFSTHKPTPLSRPSFVPSSCPAHTNALELWAPSAQVRTLWPRCPQGCPLLPGHPPQHQLHPLLERSPKASSASLAILWVSFIISDSPREARDYWKSIN